MLCHASLEGLLGLIYIKVGALLCALNITELVPGCFIHGVDQSLSSGLARFEVDLNFMFLEDSSEYFPIHLPYMG